MSDHPGLLDHSRTASVLDTARRRHRSGDALLGARASCPHEQSRAFGPLRARCLLTGCFSGCQGKPQGPLNALINIMFLTLFLSRRHEFALAHARGHRVLGDAHDERLGAEHRPMRLTAAPPGGSGPAGASLALTNGRGGAASPRARRPRPRPRAGSRRGSPRSRWRPTQPQGSAASRRARPAPRRPRARGPRSASR